MQKWQYRPVWVDKSIARPTPESKELYWIVGLDKLGEEGWEAVGLAVVDEQIVVLLKRQKT